MKCPFPANFEVNTFCYLGTIRYSTGFRDPETGYFYAVKFNGRKAFAQDEAQWICDAINEKIARSQSTEKGRDNG